VQALSQVDVERSTPSLSVEEKVAHYVKITMLYLEDDNAVDAERSFVKARIAWLLHCMKSTTLGVVSEMFRPRSEPHSGCGVLFLWQRLYFLTSMLRDGHNDR
jgi:hypothetical protein